MDVQQPSRKGEKAMIPKGLLSETPAYAGVQGVPGKY